MCKVEKIIEEYNFLVKGIETKANDDYNRAFGGVIRAGKGSMVESITRQLLDVAWEELGGKPERLTFNKVSKKLPIKKAYVEGLEDTNKKNYILENFDNYFYRLKSDVHCNIDNKLILAVECKAYTENAMMKRILVDFTLMKHGWPDIKCFLLQLESQLGGDYSQLDSEITYGSHSTNTLFSYFDVEIDIITLLEGERKVKKPIHNPLYFKELKRVYLEESIEKFKKVLIKHL